MEFLEGIVEYLDEINFGSVSLRTVLSAILGGLIGIEREMHGRAAGLRTHMLVAMGACLTAMLGVYLAGNYPSDPQRIGAQVMSGIGFIGAGTILLKKGNSRITGLTTAAGIWATAAVGLGVGYGFYFGSLLTALCVVLAFTLVGKIEFFLMRKRQKAFVYMEIDDVNAVQGIIAVLEKEYGAKDLQVTPARSNIVSHVGLETLVSIPPKTEIQEKIEHLYSLNHVVFVLPVE